MSCLPSFVYCSAYCSLYLEIFDEITPFLFISLKTGTRMHLMSNRDDSSLTVSSVSYGLNVTWPKLLKDEAIDF